MANTIQKKLGVTDQEAFSLALGVGAYGGVEFNKGFASAGIKQEAAKRKLRLLNNAIGKYFNVSAKFCEYIVLI